MADTRPNIVVPPMTVIDIYAAMNLQAGFPAVTVGDRLELQMIGNGIAFLYSGAELTGRPTDLTGYEPIYGRETATNQSGDSGAFVWSDAGCTINVEAI